MFGNEDMTRLWFEKDQIDCERGYVGMHSINMYLSQYDVQLRSVITY